MLETTVNELDSNFHRSLIRLRRFSDQNQMISKKKGLRRNSVRFSVQIQVISEKEKVFMCTETHFYSSTSSQVLFLETRVTPISFGGDYFRF